MVGPGGRGLPGRRTAGEFMKVGVPAEVEDNEFRVAITPAGVHELARAGHQVLVEAGAGAGSSLPDEEFAAAGATILRSADDVWAEGDLVLKVKEPVPGEYHRLRAGQVLFTFLHLAASRKCTEELLARGVTAIGYETVRLPGGTLPLLAPMSEVAGRMALQVGAHHLQRGRRRPRPADGRGVRRVRGHGGDHRRRGGRPERGRHRARHAGRGAAARRERRPAGPRGRPLPRALPDGAVQRRRDRAGGPRRRPGDRRGPGARGQGPRAGLPATWSPG